MQQTASGRIPLPRSLSLKALDERLNGSSETLDAGEPKPVDKTGKWLL